jgi:excisionase family DNA binding protein
VSEKGIKRNLQIAERNVSDSWEFGCNETGNGFPLTVTVVEAAKILGFSCRQIRTLINNKQIAHIRLGSRPMIPRDAIGRFLLENTVEPCRDETPVLASDSLRSEIASTSSGQKAVAAASAQRALQICNSLKRARRIHPRSDPDGRAAGSIQSPRD